MVNLKEVENLISEAQYLQEKKLDHNLVKIFAKDWDGTEHERDLLKRLKKSLKDNIYIEAIYILTHQIVKDSREAKDIFKKIQIHKQKLAKKIGRKVGIEVAALDYSTNIKRTLKTPQIIESSKISEIAEKALTDEITHLYDHESFSVYLKSEINRSKRYRIPLSLLFCDLDDFKKINDSLGHLAGDEILKKTAASLKKTLRITDKVFRYGGEEFVCLLPETNLKNAAKLAKRILKQISGIKIPDKTNKSILTMSIGGSQFGTNDVFDAKSLISSADQMMYKAKKAGKNCFCSFETEQGKDLKQNKNDIYKDRIILLGEVLSKGCSIGNVYLYKDIYSRELNTYSIKNSEISSELRRINNAIRIVLNDLNEMKKNVSTGVSISHAQIFEFHKTILKDKKFINDIENELKNELVNAEQVIKNVFRKWINKFESTGNEMLKSKVNDLKDINSSILKALLGIEKSVLEKIPKDTIIVAKRLLPSDTINIKKENIKGIVTEEGSVLSHSGILAKGLGIPAISNINFISKKIESGSKIIIDGREGKIIINPHNEDINNFNKIINSLKSKKDEPILLRKIKTQDGISIKVSANASSQAEVSASIKNGADSIGLLRSENIYLSSKIFPDQEYLFKQYSEILEKAKNKEITIRLLDIGGDKKLPYLKIEDEYSPLLGLRGIRLLFRHESLLRTQIKVLILLRQKFNIRLLIPMVTIPEEVNSIRKIVSEIIKDYELDNNKKCKRIKIGSMIETPSAFLSINEIAKLSDFLSIGTNDLIQYTMCAGRENRSVSYYYEKGENLILKIIKKIIQTAKKNNIECCLCGEIANDLNITEKLIKMGLTNFSVTANNVSSLKNLLKRLSVK